MRHQLPARPDSISELAEAVRSAAVAAGLGDGDYQLIHSGTNDVFKNSRNRVVARVASSYIKTSETQSRLVSCRQLAAAGVPILPPLVDEVVELDRGRHISFWPLAQADVELSGPELAVVLTACHRSSPPPGLADWHPDLFVDRRWATLQIGIDGGLPDDMADTMRQIFPEALARLKQIYRRLSAGLADSFIHGDTHHSNFVRYEGRLSLCDPDNICRGPREKDLANIWECCRRSYINPSIWTRVLADYSLEYNQELLEILTRVQEIGGCMWLSQYWGSRPETRPALVRCLETIDKPNEPWANF